MSTQLDPQEKKLQAKQALDTDTVQLKYKGNQKQFKLNAEVDNIYKHRTEETNSSSSTTSLLTEDKKAHPQAEAKIVEEYES